MKPFTKTFSFVAIFTLVLCAFSSLAMAASVGVFEFRDWSGPAINVHFVEPDLAGDDAPIVIVMHGVRRNADDYRDNWIGIAESYGFRVYAPEFDADRFPGAQSYNLGSAGGEGASAFDAIDPLFEAIKQRTNSSADGYFLFGHSAGAQFAHRFVMFRPEARFSLVVAANAGWYTLPSKEWNWPYGLAGGDAIEADLAAAFQKPLLILLGAEDNDPNAPFLRRTREARAQGSHRLARGLNFIKVAREQSQQYDGPLSWRVEIVPGAGHDNALMAKAAADIFQNAAKQEAE